MNAFKGKVILVTGAASGIGKATVENFIKEGGIVFGFDRDKNGLSQIEGLHPCPVDMVDHEGLKQHVEKIIGAYNRIDVLVNCAGMSYYTRLLDSTLEEWRYTMAVNLEGYYLMAKLVVPSMVKNRNGRIVNVSSTQAIASEPTVGAYAATKGGVTAWTRTLAVDLAEHGILVNSVAPGCIQTAMSIIDGINETETDYFQEWYVKHRKIPLARAGKAEEVAKSILFLSGDDCTYITGHNLVVDGGLTISM